MKGKQHILSNVFLVTQPAFTCSKLTIETLEQRFIIVNFEHISHLCSSVSIVNFEQVIAGWEVLCLIYFKIKTLV